GAGALLTVLAPAGHGGGPPLQRLALFLQLVVEPRIVLCASPFHGGPPSRAAGLQTSEERRDDAQVVGEGALGLLARGRVGGAQDRRRVHGGDHELAERRRLEHLTPVRRDAERAAEERLRQA